MLCPPSVLCAGREFHWWGWPPCSRCHHWIVQRTWSNRYPQKCSSSNLPLSNLCFLGACKVLAVARCSTMALIISSKKNQEQSVTSFLVWSLDKVSCRASCSWTSFPRLVLPSAASAPRSPPGYQWYNLSFFWHFIFRLHPLKVHIDLPTIAIMWYHCPFQFKYKDFIICLYRKYTCCYHNTILSLQYYWIQMASMNSIYRTICPR